MKHSFKEIKVVTAYLDNEFKESLNMNRELIMDFRKIPWYDSATTSLLAIQWDYKTHANNNLLLDYVCDVIYFIDLQSYSYMPIPKFDSLILYSHTRAFKSFKKVTIPQASEESLVDLRKKIIDKFYLKNVG